MVTSQRRPRCVCAGITHPTSLSHNVSGLHTTKATLVCSHRFARRLVYAIPHLSGRPRQRRWRLRSQVCTLARYMEQPRDICDEAGGDGTRSERFRWAIDTTTLLQTLHLRNCNIGKSALQNSCYYANATDFALALSQSMTYPFTADAQVGALSRADPRIGLISNVAMHTCM